MLVKYAASPPADRPLASRRHWRRRRRCHRLPTTVAMLALRHCRTGRVLEDTFFKKAKVRCRWLLLPVAGARLEAVRSRLAPGIRCPHILLGHRCHCCRLRATWPGQPTSCWRSSRSTSSSRLAARCGSSSRFCRLNAAWLLLARHRYIVHCSASSAGPGRC